jgi:hypothetical protein
MRAWGFEVASQHDREQLVDFRAMGWGCLTWFACWLCLMGVAFLLLTVPGIHVSRRTVVAPPWMRVFSFALWVFAYGFVGYVVARKARVAPMRQAVLFGGVFLLLNAASHMLYVVLSLIVRSALPELPSPTHALSWSTLAGWLLAIPLMLLGARLAVSSSVKTDAS